MALVGQQGREADAAVIVDRDVQVLIAHAADVIAGVAGDGMARPVDVGQAFDVEMHQVARAVVLIAHYRWRRIERTQTVQARSAQDTADGGPAQLELVSNAPAVPAQPAKRPPIGKSGPVESDATARNAGNLNDWIHEDSQDRWLVSLIRSLSHRVAFRL